MIRGTMRWLRPAAVWAAATVGVVAAWMLAGPSAALVVDPSTWSGDFAALLEPVCAVAFVVTAAWLWVLTTATIAGVLRGRTPVSGSGVVRRLVLLACGVAVVAGTAAPVAAAGGGDQGSVAGLRLPDRPVGAPHSRTVDRPAPPTPRTAQSADADVHVVRPGESLWSVAEQVSRPGTDLDAAWRAIWDANREVVGDDPDLILPGQHLRLPNTDTRTDTAPPDRGTAPDQTGDRP